MEKVKRFLDALYTNKHVHYGFGSHTWLSVKQKCIALRMWQVLNGGVFFCQAIVEYEYVYGCSFSSDSEQPIALSHCILCWCL